MTQSATGGVRRTDRVEPETPVDWAMYYSVRGCKVFPVFEIVRNSDGGFRCACNKDVNCPDAGKHPRTEHGFLDATTDETQIRRWWKKWPNANIGIRTGDGWIILDVDINKGGDESLELLEAKYGKLPETRQALTGSGGSHHWFRLPEGMRVGCFNGIKNGLDVRADGGYVVAEPSVHRSGNIYRWDGIAGFNAPAADVPKWLLDVLVAKRDNSGAHGEERRRIDIRVNRRPELPRPLHELLENDSTLSQLWNLRRADFTNPKTGNPDFSRYDLALAAHFAAASVPHQQIADIVTAFRLKHGNPKGKGHRLEYLQRTIYKALKRSSGGGIAPPIEAIIDARGECVQHDLGGEQTAGDTARTAAAGPSLSVSNAESTAARPSGDSGHKDSVPSSVEFLAAKVAATRDFALIYQHINLLAGLSESGLAVVYQRLKAALGYKLDRTHFEKAVREARGRLRQKEPKTPAAQSANGPGHPYRERNGSIVRVKEGKDGAEEIIPLANFIAKITSDIGEDDGAEVRRFFGIDAICARKTYSFIVPANRFASMEWPIENIGPNAIVQPNQKDWARAAIQSLSTAVQSRQIYIHTGWRKVGDSMLYLHGGGAIGANGAVLDVDVRLSGALAHYALLLPESRDQLVVSVRASLQLLDIAPDHVMFPIVSSTYRAPVRPCDFAGWLGGPTGVFKSELAALAQQHFGAAMNARRLPGSFASTGNALEMLAFSTKDALLVIDDFAPHGGMQDVARYHAAADRILRAAGNSQGRGRLSSDARLREAKPPRGLILATGEDMPRGQSIRGRTLIIEVAPGDVRTNTLTECQVAATSGAYARAMGGFVQWLAARYDQTQAAFQVRVLELRSQATRVHSRTPGIVADLHTGFELFLEFANTVGAISAEEKQTLTERCWKALNRVAQAQRVQQDAVEPARRFLDLLRAAVLSGQAYVAGLEGGAPAGDGRWGWQLTGSGEHARMVNRGKCVGWLDGGNLYLEPNASFGVAQDLGRSTGEPLVVGQTTLNKRLNEKGLLAGVDGRRGTLTIRKRICGNSIPVLHLRADALASYESNADATNVNAPAGEPEVFTC